MAVDPGDKRIGIAISDLTGTIANPFRILIHSARKQDAANLVQVASDNGVDLIVVGIALDSEGNQGFQARKSIRLSDAIKQITQIPVKLWDESDSTLEALSARTQIIGHHKRKKPVDALAATVILQTYIDAHR
jgi:putative holliday junction resolvase